MAEHGAGGTRVPESRALTGLRGVGALLVVAHHLYLQVGLDQKIPFLQWVLKKGYLGVDLFFVLSGFVMAMVYGTWFQHLRPRSGPPLSQAFLLFMVRRVARIWPLHAAVILVVLALRWVHGQPGFSFRVVAENLAMVQAWGHSTEINIPAWSISTEFMAYLLFPVLAAFTLRGMRRMLIPVAGVAIALGVAVYFAPPVGPMRRGWLDIYYNFSPLPALRSLAGFVIGMLAWRMGRVPWVQARAALPWVGGTALLAFFAMMLGRVNDLLILPVMPLVILGMHYGRGWGQRVLETAPVHALGVISYAIYLVHFGLLRGVPLDRYPMRYMLPCYAVATIAVAVVAHVFIERPGRVLLRRAGEAAVAALWPKSAPHQVDGPLQDRAQ